MSLKLLPSNNTVPELRRSFRRLKIPGSSKRKNSPVRALQPQQQSPSGENDSTVNSDVIKDTGPQKMPALRQFLMPTIPSKDKRMEGSSPRASRKLRRKKSRSFYGSLGKIRGRIFSEKASQQLDDADMEPQSHEAKEVKTVEKSNAISRVKSSRTFKKASEFEDSDIERDKKFITPVLAVTAAEEPVVCTNGFNYTVTLRKTQSSDNVSKRESSRRAISEFFGSKHQVWGAQIKGQWDNFVKKTKETQALGR